ncbi:MAG: peroxiredoxin family protein [Lentisphaeria bacterium]|nr:MAG: peroxiredoxin family protein [Lentisphaeria bacterium]
MQFVAIGCDSADSIAKFNRLNELPFPVAADNMLATVNRYMRSNDRIPMAAIIDRNGVLAWRGAVGSLAGVLPEVIAGKFNIQQHVEREKFSQAVMSAIRIKDYPSALKLLDDELKKNPGNLELLNVKLPLQGKLMKDLDGAEKSALAAVEKESEGAAALLDDHEASGERPPRPSRTMDRPGGDEFQRSAAGPVQVRPAGNESAARLPAAVERLQTSGNRLEIREIQG